MLQLWKSIVIHRLDYCSQLWSPHHIGLIQQLEELQRAFIKRISGCQDKTYHEAFTMKAFTLWRGAEKDIK